MPTRKTIFWLLGALVLYLIAWNIGSGWLYILTAMLVAFPLVSILLGRANIRRQLEVRMGPAASAYAGDSLTATLALTNRSRLPRFFISLECSFGGGQTSLFVPYIGSRKSIEQQLTFSSLRRGLYTGACVILRSGAPMGLSRTHRNCFCDNQLTVYPAWSRLGNDWSAGQWATGYMASSSLPSRSASSDYLGVRDYHSDDSQRSIHWRSTARRSKLSVVEYSRQSVVMPVIMLDSFGGGDTGPATPDSVFEAMVSAAASLVQREAGNNRRFAIGQDPETAADFKLGHGCDAAMLWLAAVEPGANHPMDLGGSLPWPGATPVLILASRREYGHLHESALLQAHPHAAIIMFNVRMPARHAPGGPATDRETPTARSFMDDKALASLEMGLEAIGSRLLIIDDPEELAQCLRFL